ncbi:MAG: tRNA (N6-isopentenyl adenosine(37)-C2)-methylthiotransferase MiaB [Clostridia bacterium]|nr:tRNA (N6-isopentenyl adenosine(37)-C2)-methylthiotransferase MiaB [Clostridia bacterium]
MVKHITEQEVQKQNAVCEYISSLNYGKQKFALVITLGCVQNENDSEIIRGLLTKMGYTMCTDAKQADVVIYNTCAVRENAELKVFGYLGALKSIKAKKPDMLVGICGCMIQQKHIVEKIKKTYPYVDMVFGTHSLYKFPEIMQKALSEKVIDVEDVDGYVVENMPHLRTSLVASTVSVMYGCNNFCSYCIVPYVRGRERSRKHEEIIKEVEQLAKNGCKEITLVGQNVNSYGKDCGEIDFADLLKLVSDVDGIERIRFVSAHPKDMSDKLIDTVASLPKVCNQLHVPFQSGSSKVLKDMNRKYTKEQYLELISKIRKRIPDVALTADIIVGFPTETDADFNETMDVVKTVGFDMLFTFIYSKRKGTPAASMDFVNSEENIKKNFNTLIDTQAGIVNAINQKLKDKAVSVLVEGFSKTNDNMLTGRTESGKIVNFPGSNELIGKLIDVKITKIATWSLTGEIIKGEN